MRDVIYGGGAAEDTESLLSCFTCLLLEEGYSSFLTPEMEVVAYKLVMRAWSLAFHPSSGVRCEAGLERYGERCGGI